MRYFKEKLFEIAVLLNNKRLIQGERPNILIKLSFLYKIIELMNFLFIIGIFLYTFVNYFDFPNEIPLHFTWDGSADKFASKIYIFFHLIIILSVFAILTYFQKNYSKLNYPININRSNANYQYELVIKYYILMKFINNILFGYIYYCIIIGSYDKSKAYLGFPFLFLLIMIFIINIIYHYLARKDKPKKE